ncbi:MAG: T9SS type A sorting domain-containing protein [Bacteroidia bacterium]
MKLRLLILFLLFFKAGFSQLYQPFPTDSAEWRQHSGTYYYPWINYRDYIYYIPGDTIIASNSYHKIYRTQIVTGEYYYSPSGPFSIVDGPRMTDTNLYVGAFREDTLKHIYYYPDTATVTGEQLLYDFNLTVGDTLPSYNSGYFAGTNYVSALDSILIGGAYHKRYHISNPSGYIDFVQIVEGVGSTFGLLENLIDPFEWSDNLICFSRRGVKVYSPDTTTTDCSLPVPLGISEAQTKPEIRIFPNPTSGQIEIEASGFYGKTLRITNMLGEVVYVTKMENRVSLDLTSLPKGVYFLKAISDEGQTSTQKIILQ